MKANELKNYKLFLDLDGVLADFDSRVYEILGDYPNNLKQNAMWKELKNPKHDFYYSLNFMKDGLQLWNYCKSYNPTIITGCPLGNWAPKQKERWVHDNLGPDVSLITCMAKEKYKYSDINHILIDDRPEKSKNTWETSGGIFITHKNAIKSIEELKKLGL